MRRLPPAALRIVKRKTLLIHHLQLLRTLNLGDFNWSVRPVTKMGCSQYLYLNEELKARKRSFTCADEPSVLRGEFLDSSATEKAD